VVGAPCSRADGKLPVAIGATEKMSKSKNNGVDPQVHGATSYGADTVRLFSMFAAPPEQSLEWNEAGVEGMARFLRRLWAQVQRHRQDGAAGGLDLATLDATQKSLRRQLHECIQKVGDDYGRRHSFNTAIAAVMEFLNHLSKFDDATPNGRALRQESLEAVVLLLNPITPHASHALWQALGHGETLIENLPFPVVDAAALVRDALTLAVQVNGKLRGTIEVAANAARESIEAQARDEPNVQRFLEGVAVKKIIIVPGKIVNIVAA
jgi:leucyl-tRNA synthetase